MPQACQYSRCIWITPSTTCFDFWLAWKWWGSWTWWFLWFLSNQSILIQWFNLFLSLAITKLHSQLIKINESTAFIQHFEQNSFTWLSTLSVPWPVDELTGRSFYRAVRARCSSQLSDCSAGSWIWSKFCKSLPDKADKSMSVSKTPTHHTKYHQNNSLMSPLPPFSFFLYIIERVVHLLSSWQFPSLKDYEFPSS